MDAVPRIGADDLVALVPPADAVRALAEALHGGLDPEAEPARTITDLTSGQLLLMPSEGAGYAGVKIASVAPGNPARGLPRIGAVYVLLDAATLLPVALLDGTALTSLRTPAVSALAVRHLLPSGEEPLRVVVFGAGPQAWGHIEALATVRAFGHVTVVGRSPRPAAEVVARCEAEGVAAEAGTADAVASADVVLCCTSAREPLFDGALVRDGAVVVAVGSHEPDARELDSALVARAAKTGALVVESRAAALREPGDILVPLGEGVLEATALAPLADLVTGRLAAPGPGPRVFKSVGMGWEDLVVAGAAHRRISEALSV
ncbi:ornithine cyclodeaminase family protein [Yinghuangia seranimata]|nr:ornithine cyclodeaminase family protein [Yinghuangia seranimata]MDI2132054.1 ornithine cyclodeaminase family protein [Yinghuangia seranimata]